MQTKQKPYVPEEERIVGGQTLSAAVNGDVVKRVLATATTPGAAEYFAVRMKEHELADVIRNFAEGVSAQYGTSGDYWTGRPDDSDFQKFQDFLGGKAAEALKTAGKDTVKFNFALSKISEFIRGASANGEKLPPELMDAIDKLFNSWLVKNDMVSEGSAIYQSDQQGVIATDKGQKVKADKQRIIALINDPEKGFAKFAADKGVTVTQQEHAYPEEKSEAEMKEEAKEVAKAETKVEAAPVETKEATTEVAHEVHMEETPEAAKQEAPSTQADIKADLQDAKAEAKADASAEAAASAEHEAEAPQSSGGGMSGGGGGGSGA